MNIKHLLEELKYFTDNLTDNTVSLIEHAKPRDFLHELINNKAYFIVEHIYKIMVFENSEKYKTDIHHWASEIASGLRTFIYKKIKSKNVYLTKEQITKYIQEEFVDSDELKEIYVQCCTDYEYHNVNLNEIYEKIFKILPKIIEYMRENVPYNINDIENIILN